MKQAASVPKVAFVVNLADTSRDEAYKARAHHLLHLFSGHRLPATWIVDCPEQASLMRKQHSSSASCEVALRIDPQRLSTLSSHSQFRAELSSRIAALNAASGTTTQLVFGDPHLLRSRAAILADQGIEGILSEPQDRPAPSKPRPLPCGLWQLQPSTCIPQKRRLVNLLRGRRPSVKQLMAVEGAETTLVMVQATELGRAGARILQRLEKLLREISWAASRDQLIISTVGEKLAELVSQRAVKPQRSILREAA